MHLRPALLLAIAPSFGRIRASGIPHPTNPYFALLPVEINNIIFGQEGMGLVEYAALVGITGGEPLVTSDVAEKLISRTAEEVKRLDMNDDSQRTRLSHILEATRAVMGQHCALPMTILPDTDIPTLKELAAQFEIAFLTYASLSNSPTWAKYCMAALLGKDTLINLLPFLSEGFVRKTFKVMLQAAAVAENFDTLRAITEHLNLSYADSYGCIYDDILFKGSVEFVQTVAALVPEFTHHMYSMLGTAIQLNHRSLFKYLYDETMKQSFHILEPWKPGAGITVAVEECAGRGWEDVFEQLYREHPQCLNMPSCLERAAKHGRTNILKYILFQDTTLAEKAIPVLRQAFEVALGSGNIDASRFFLGNDEKGDPIISHLYLDQPSPLILETAAMSGRWEGIEHVLQLRDEGDRRFDRFKLVGNANWAMKLACNDGNLEVLKQLLQRDSQGQYVFTFYNPRVLWVDALVRAALGGHHLIVQELLKQPHIDLAFENNEVMLRACSCDHHLVVRELLRDERVDAGVSNNAPLRVACKYGSLLVVRELMQKDDNGKYIHNVDPTSPDNQPVILACESGNLLVVRELLQQKGVDPRAQNNEALRRACGFGHLLIVRELLQRDGDGNYIYNVDPAANNNQALDAAREQTNHLVVQELLQHAGVTLALADNQGPIDACARGQLNEANSHQ